MDEGRGPPCPFCSAPVLHPEARFCIGCGRELGGRCKHCDALLPDPAARYCISCGSPLDPPAPAKPPDGRCKRCDAILPDPAARFCISCGARVEPAASGPVRRRFRWIALAALAALLFGAIGLAARSTPSRVAEARLVVPSARDWRVVVEQPPGPALALDVGDARMVAGRHVILLEPRRPEGGAGAEVVVLTLEPGAVHVHVPGGAPLSLHAIVDGTPFLWRGRLPPARALRMCRSCGLIRFDARCAGCDAATELVPVEARVRLEGLGPFDAGTDEAVFIANPYAALVECEVEAGETTLRFVLDGPTTRAVPRPADGRLLVRAWTPPGGERIDERRIEVPAGLSVVAVGGATSFAWRDVEAARGRIVPPDLAASIAREPGARVAGTDLSSGLLTVRTSGGAFRYLHGAATAPLLPPRVEEPADLLAHPEVRIRELEPAASLRGKVATTIATDGAAIAAVCDGVMYDFATGERLHAAEEELRIVSAGATGNGLFLVTQRARAATIRDGRLVEGPSVLDPTLEICAGEDGMVLLFGGQALRGLYEVGRGAPAVVLRPAGTVVTAVARRGRALLVARERTVDELVRSASEWTRRPVVSLPPGPPIIGLHDAGGRLLLSTADGLHALEGDVVLPLVTGLGGRLHAYGKGVLIHDRRSRRLFAVEGRPVARAE